MNDFLFDEKPFDIIHKEPEDSEQTPSVSFPFVVDLLKETGKIRVEILKMQRRLQQSGGGRTTSTSQQPGSEFVDSTPDPNIPKILKYIDQILRETRQIKPEIADLKDNFEDKIIVKNATDIMPALDAFGRMFDVMDSIEAPDPTMKSWFEGIRQIHNSLMRWLKQNGIEEIECLGKTFDPKLHAAISTTSDPSKPNNTIAKVEKRGFLRKGIPIRYPEVVVVKNQD